MGQYRLAFYFKMQLGLNLLYEYQQFEIVFPFVTITIAIQKDAKGIRFFK